MKYRILAPLLSLLFLVNSPAADGPNIVLFFIDDMGYGDIGPFGSNLSDTPNLDRMAKEGVTLTNFYVSATACTPSRSSLMTGCYADRLDMDRSVVFPGDDRGLNPSEVTIADMLKAHGYATACVGKWHLGDAPEFMPGKQGFDTYTGIPYSNDMWSGHKSHPPLPFIKNHDAVAHISDGLDQALLGDALSDAAVEFITESKDQPFFLYFPHSMVHVPRYVLQARADKHKGQQLEPAALALKIQIEEIDASVGRVMETLKTLGLTDNTLIFFTSDNGGSSATSMGGLRGGKGGAKYEGHMRAATVATWPGRIPSGLETAGLASTIDLLPTIASITGAKVPENCVIDGKDITALLTKPGATSPHPYMFYEYEGIREGDWKLVLPKPKKNQKPAPELYDLSTDPGEENNIAAAHPDKVAKFSALLKAHYETVHSGQRPAGYVENPKPIDTKGLPSLSTLLGRDGESVMTEGALRGNSNRAKDDVRGKSQ